MFSDHISSIYTFIFNKNSRTGCILILEICFIFWLILIFEVVFIFGSSSLLRWYIEAVLTFGFVFIFKDVFKGSTAFGHSGDKTAALLLITEQKIFIPSYTCDGQRPEIKIKIKVVVEVQCVLLVLVSVSVVSVLVSVSVSVSDFFKTTLRLAQKTFYRVFQDTIKNTSILDYPMATTPLL